MTNEVIIGQLENAIGLIKQDGKDWLDDRDIPILEACIKSLTALDKIRTEINGIEINGQVDEYTMFIRTGEQVKQMALDIIDKYKAESEDKETYNNDDGWCNTCEYKHLGSECQDCAKYDEYDNLITLSKYKKESDE